DPQGHNRGGIGMSKKIGDLSEQELVDMIKKMESTELPGHAGQDVTVRGGGTVQVKNQQLFVQDPAGDGPLPVIRPMAPVRLFVNDRESIGETTVSAKDRITWSISEEPLFVIRVAEDKMAVYLRVIAKERYAW